jgi:CrcB protein
MNTLQLILLSGLFGGVGAACRALAILLFTERWGRPFWLTVLVVNVLGSCVAGACTELFQKLDPSGIAAAAVIGGILGGFTTFSSFAIECIEQWQRGHRSRSAIYAIGSMLACGAAAWLGFEAARGIHA